MRGSVGWDRLQGVQGERGGVGIGVRIVDAPRVSGSGGPENGPS